MVDSIDKQNNVGAHRAQRGRFIAGGATALTRTSHLASWICRSYRRRILSTRGSAQIQLHELEEKLAFLEQLLERKEPPKPLPSPPV